MQSVLFVFSLKTVYNVSEIVFFQQNMYEPFIDLRIIYSYVFEFKWKFSLILIKYDSSILNLKFNKFSHEIAIASSFNLLAPPVASFVYPIFVWILPNHQVLHSYQCSYTWDKCLLFVSK